LGLEIKLSKNEIAMICQSPTEMKIRQLADGYSIWQMKIKLLSNETLLKWLPIFHPKPLKGLLNSCNYDHWR